MAVEEKHFDSDDDQKQEEDQGLETISIDQYANNYLDPEEPDYEESLREFLAVKKQAVNPENLIYNEKELKECLENIQLRMPLGKAVPWIEKLDLLTQQPTYELVPDVHDDKHRELIFYETALIGAKQGAHKLESLAIPFRRPEDYFAEMLKSDDHMKKIKGRLLFQARSLEQSETASKIREQKKFGKKVAIEKKKESQKKKKEQLDSIKKWKKGRQLGIESRSIEELLENANSSVGLEKPKVNMKRQKKNEKYGKKIDKRKQSNDPKDIMKDWKNMKSQKKGSKKRPGKSKRKG